MLTKLSFRLSWIADRLQATIDQVWSRHQGQATIDQQTPLFNWKDANSDCATSLRSSERQVFTAGSTAQASTETIQQPLAFRDATAHPPIACTRDVLHLEEQIAAYKSYLAYFLGLKDVRILLHERIHKGQR